MAQTAQYPSNHGKSAPKHSALHKRHFEAGSALSQGEQLLQHHVLRRRIDRKYRPHMPALRRRTCLRVQPLLTGATFGVTSSHPACGSMPCACTRAPKARIRSPAFRAIGCQAQAHPVQASPSGLRLTGAQREPDRHARSRRRSRTTAGAHERLCLSLRHRSQYDPIPMATGYPPLVRALSAGALRQLITGGGTLAGHHESCVAAVAFHWAFHLTHGSYAKLAIPKGDES